MKLVKLQSRPKYVQSWNVINTCFSEMQSWNSDVLKHPRNLFNLMEEEEKKKNNKGN